MTPMLAKEYPKSLGLKETIKKQGIYKDYQYFITVADSIHDKNSNTYFQMDYCKGYILIMPNQQGYSCTTNYLEENDDITKIVFDEKDSHNNRIIGFNTINTKDSDDYYPDPVFSNWTPSKLVNECKLIIDDLADFDKNVISVEVVSLLQDIRKDREISDLTVESFKKINSILNTEQSHNAVKAIKKAKIKDTDKNIRNAFNILNKALFQAHINVFDCAYDYWN